jgi:hypothetical protein
VTFKPGQSGNPKGRAPIVRDFRARCQTFMSKSGWAQLEHLASDATSPHHFRAIELILAYAHGRPTQPLAGDADPDMPPMTVTVLFDKPLGTDVLETGA